MGYDKILTVSIHGQGCTVDYFRVIASQEEDHACDVFRLRPLCTVSVAHC